MALAVHAGELVIITAVWFFALRTWNLGALSPVAAIAQLFRQREARMWVVGALRFLAGTILALAALLLLYLVLDRPESGEFSAFAIGTFVTALAVDFLLGTRATV